ncbi:phytanoyl-CoA dioxygenase family protein [Sphingomonas bacterium]|uniref:phytanoyl-CoA dioxygenase family protein n=1 Tax=Sphingomonas bacterium TaxID=1895847 RepID=UPI001576CC2A|nr:phytanoyl-CoA dioxygenase family protein [Sphingomonas bacterium]
MQMTPAEGAVGSTMLPRRLFNEQAYLLNNKDVAEAVARGEVGAYEHYARHGHWEEVAGGRVRSYPRQGPALSVRSSADTAILDRLIDLEIDHATLLEAWDRNLASLGPITFDMLSEEVDDEVIPPLDQAKCDEAGLDEDQLSWRRNGFLIKENFFPHELLDRYAEIRARHPDVGGWSCPVPYMYVGELRDVSLYPPLMKLMEKLIGEEMGLHLNLTGWVSTDRNWHQDDYLNPPYINSWYAAAWIALDDIHPDCGPFEFVPGSHKWPLMKGHKVRMFLSQEERNDIGWPSRAERVVNDIAAAEIERRGVPTQKFIAKKGDLLIWHGRLMHRGSYANVPGMQRKTLISHYSGITHRVDMKDVARTDDGSAYFRHYLPLDFDPYR